MFNRIGLIGKVGDASILAELEQVVALLRQRRLAWVCDQATADLAGLGCEAVMSATEMADQVDLIVVVGGDGTLLGVARDTHHANMRLCGVNRGHLGFLTDILPEAIDQQLAAVLDGAFVEESRFLLTAQVWRDDQVIAEGTAFNDIVVHRTDVARMIELRSSIDGRLVNMHRADGLIIASPTGSTAYALSAGGPLLHPGLDAVALVPICPHTLSNRPIVVAADSVIEIALSDPAESEGQVTFDGHLRHPLRSGDRVVFRRSQGVVRLLHPEDHDYFEILREKLNWGLGRA